MLTQVSFQAPTIRFVSVHKAGISVWAHLELNEGGRRATLDITIWDPTPEQLRWLYSLNTPDCDELSDPANHIIEHALGDRVELDEIPY